MKGLTFYDVSAQVIPVLVLVLVVDLRVSRHWPHLPRHLRFLTFASLILCGLGEYRALRVLQTENAGPVDPWLVGGTIMGLGLAVIASSTGNPFTPAKNADDE